MRQHLIWRHDVPVPGLLRLLGGGRGACRQRRGAEGRCNQHRRGRCADCHEPHGSEHPRLQTQAGGAACTKCHPTSASFRADHGGYPVEEANCQQCHDPHASTATVDSNDPTNRVGGTNQGRPYHGFSASTATPMNSATIANAGGGVGHNNMQPYLGVNFCIALQGLFPSRN